MKKTIIILLALQLSVLLAGQNHQISQADKSRAASLVSQMTLDEKIDLLSGKKSFFSAEIARLGIPSIRMADGPQGVRNNTNSTYYPCGLALAASFNREVAGGVGDGIGCDATARGVRVMLCPGVNIYRSPLCGRNFEYYGEDPYLASEMACNYINGIQQHNVIATIKHFATNNQEYRRHWTSSMVDERTLNEIYFPTFRKAVENGVGAVMTSYNPINGVHAAENEWLIKDNLRKWGFEGIVMSDWVATYTTLGVLTSGLDLEMPKNLVTAPELVKPLVENGVVSESNIDQMCQHILQTFISFGLFDNPATDSSIPLDYDYSRTKAYEAAVQAPVLLTNNGLLPIKKGNIVVLGPNANVVAFGGGSGSMQPFENRNISLYAGMKTLGKGYNVTLIENAELTDGDREAIKKASAVIISCGFNSKTEYEGADRTYELPEGQNELILQVAGLNKNVAVVINSGGEVDINSFKDEVSAIMMAWYGGQEGGRALADLLTGKVSPSGKLPFTFWGSLEANPVDKYYHEINAAGYKMYNDRNPYPQTTYAEGVFVGYRGVERFGVKPMFAFGYGLSYTQFEYSDLEVKAAPDGGFDVSFYVKNTGKCNAYEAAQVYVSPLAPSVLRPAKELKGFEKKLIAKGKTEKYTVHLKRSDFSYYDISTHNWKVDEGKYKILVGPCSADITLESEVKVVNGLALDESMLPPSSIRTAPLRDLLPEEAPAPATNAMRCRP